LGEMAVDAVGRDVERAVLVPFDRDGVGRVAGVLDPGVGLDPVDALAVLAPELVRIVDGGLVHRLVFGVVRVGALAPLGRAFVNLLGHVPSSTRRRLLSWRIFRREPAPDFDPGGADSPTKTCASLKSAGVSSPAIMRRGRRERQAAGCHTLVGPKRRPGCLRAIGRYGSLNSWFGKLDASGGLMTMKPWFSAVWQELHPSVSAS